MRILHIDEERTWRGGEQQASYLIAGLAQRGHTNFIAGRTGSPFTERDHGPNTVAQRLALPMCGEFDLWSAWRMAQAVKRHDIQILHAHTSHALSTACWARALAGRGKTVATRRVDFRPRNTPINRWKYAQPDHIIAISDCIARILLDSGIPRSRLTTVHSAIDPERLEASPISRSELGIPQDAPLLGNVAALVGHKDQATLLNAMPTVLESLPTLRLVIAGEGDLRPALERQIQSLGLQQAVTLLGYRTDVPRILNTLDAFVLSSKEEGLGTSILDAMACKLPIAATAAGGIPEMIHHEETGLLVPVGDAQALGHAIVRLFQEPGLAAQLAANGHSLLHERFTTDSMVEGNIAVYERLLA